MSMSLTCTVCLLRLRSNKFYIGRTANLNRQLAEHATGRGTA